MMYFISFVLVRGGQETRRRTAYVGGENISELLFTFIIHNCFCFILQHSR